MPVPVCHAEVRTAFGKNDTFACAGSLNKLREDAALTRHFGQGRY